MSVSFETVLPAETIRPKLQLFDPSEPPESETPAEPHGLTHYQSGILPEGSAGASPSQTSSSLPEGSAGASPSQTSSAQFDALQAKLDALTTLVERATSAPAIPAAREVHRLTQPVYQPAAPQVSEPVTLRACLDSDLSRNPHRRQNWGQYRTLVEYWERAWSGSGPDMRCVTSAQLFTAFSSVPEWPSRNTWKSNADRLFAMMKAQCRQTRQNKFGVPKPELAPLLEDDLPIWELPPDAWFDNRPPPPKERRGHTRSTLPLMTVAELDALMSAADWTEDPLWWKTLAGWWWFCGMRIRQTLIQLTWRTQLAEEGVDLANRCLHSRESKCKGGLEVPLPGWLCEGLQALRDRQKRQLTMFEDAAGDRPTVFHRRKKRGDPTVKRTQLPKGFYAQWDALWDRAGVPIREPHQMRGVSISWWLKHSEKYRKTVTGHSTAGDMQLSHYVTFDDDFRQAAENHPRPSLPLIS